MKGKLFLLLFPVLSVFSCKGNNEITTKCPLGAPSIIFYDQGNNKNFETISGAAQILAEFQNKKYDVLVVDATSGLKQIKQYEDCPYRLAKLITNGNLYLVSLTQTGEPTEGKTLTSFGNETSIPYLVTNKLNDTYKCKVEYSKDVSEVLAKALNNVSDYYVLAEPALTALAKQKGTLSFKKKITFDNLIIPQAALFINKNSYNNKKDKFKTYFNELNERIDNCIYNPNIVKENLKKYGDDLTVSNKFGFKTDIAYTVQENKKNGFAIYESTKKFTYEDVNNFLSNVGSKERYNESEFIYVE